MALHEHDDVDVDRDRCPLDDCNAELEHVDTREWDRLETVGTRIVECPAAGCPYSRASRVQLTATLDAY